MGIKQFKKMKKTRYIALTLLMALLTVSCEKELPKTMKVDFTATMEQPTGDSKVQLVNEQWIYWERGDEISIGSNMSTAGGEPAAKAALTGNGVGDFEEYNAVFTSYDLLDGSVNFVGLHPFSTDNRIVSAGENSNLFSTVQISLPAEQPYRNDSTFAKQVLPMVAWYGDGWVNTTPNLDFHNLAGIVRLQFYNSTGQTFTITSIGVSGDKQLSGMFNVVDYRTFDPHLTALSGSNSLTLTMPDGGLEFESDALRSFYLVLPALTGMDASTNYSLSVTVNATQGGNNYNFTKTLTVPTRRNGITYTRAIGIEQFTPSTQTSVGLVGNGTEGRPFKIYSIAELQYVRDSFAHPRNDGKVYLNGQEVTGDTYFRIMRSDIVLTSDNWTAGIQNFTGHMTYYSTAPNISHGITNRSLKPIFASISANGVVEGLAVKCDAAISGTGIDDYSPFCKDNYGIIRDCNVNTPTSGGGTLDFRGIHFGGICHTNHPNAKIIGSICTLRGLFPNNGRVGGICYTNMALAEISGCVAASPMQISGSLEVGGVCYNNAGQIKDCYNDVHYTAGTADWGGVVFTNSASGKIEHCYLSVSAIIHSDNVGGIVCNNNGTVDYCWTHGELRGTKVGAIASTNTGRLVNCFVDDQLFIITLLASGSAHYAGGLVAELNGGKIENSYVNINHIAHNDNTGVFGGLVGHITGNGNVINNCYAYELATTTRRIYGANDGTTTFTRCYLVDGTQAGGPETVDVSADAEEAMKTLKNNLRTTLPPNGKSWERKASGSGLANMPGLSPYTISGS